MRRKKFLGLFLLFQRHGHVNV